VTNLLIALVVFSPVAAVAIAILSFIFAYDADQKMNNTPDI
jgi:hypothetical protein